MDHITDSLKIVLRDHDWAHIRYVLEYPLADCLIVTYGGRQVRGISIGRWWSKLPSAREHGPSTDEAQASRLKIRDRFYTEALFGIAVDMGYLIIADPCDPMESLVIKPR